MCSVGGPASKVTSIIDVCGLPRAAEGEDRRTLAAFGRIDSTMSWVYSVSCYVAAALYLSYPLARSYYELWTSGTAEWTMPMRSM